MYTQTLKRVIELEPDWEKDNFKGMKKHSMELNNAFNAVGRLMEDPNLHLDNLKITVEAIVSQIDEGRVSEEYSLVVDDLLIDT